MTKSGQKFGKLTVVEKTEKRLHGYVLWLCKCDCGGTKLVKSINLVKGRAISCGCMLGFHGRKHEVNGEMLTPTEIAEKYNLPVHTVRRRIREGWVGSEICKPVYTRHTSCELGFDEPVTFAELAKKVGVSRQAIQQRFKRGYRGMGLIYPSSVGKKRGRKSNNEQKSM